MAAAWVPAVFQGQTGWGSWDTWDLNQRLNAWRRHFGVVDPGWQTEIVKDFVRANYGALASYLDDPEVGPLLMQAATQGWTQTTFDARLAETNWYKTTTASQREWDLLSRSDPASAKQRVDQMSTQIRTLLSQQGVSEQFTDERVTELATQLIRNGAPAEQVPQAVLAEAQYQPTAPVGKLGQTQAQAKGLAQQYGLPLSDQAAFDWAKKIATGQTTEDGLQTYLRETAKGRYASLAAQLDQGFTVKQLLDPQIQMISQTLEVDPERIDITDPKYAAILDVPDQGGTRVMTLSETAKWAKGTSDYRNTTTAKNAAGELAQTLAQTFGRA